MGFKDKISNYYTNSYLDKYGDRLTQFQGTLLSSKVEEKTILWIFHKLTATVVVRPDRSKVIMKCIYKKNSWFKKPTFLNLRQGNNLIIQGLKSNKDDKEIIEVQNIVNLTTGQDIVPVDHSQFKKARQQQTRMKR
ncbi:MAG: hypothetical protein ACRDD2_03960 [Sarcina sp.]